MKRKSGPMKTPSKLHISTWPFLCETFPERGNAWRPRPGEFGQEDMVECLLEANVDTERVDEYIEVMARANLLLYKGNGKYEYIE